MLAISVIPIAEKKHFTCAACGMGRHTITAFWLTVRDAQTDTACSDWYRKWIEPQHDHIWACGTYSGHYSAIGMHLGGSNILSRADGPIIFIPSRTRLMMYECCDDPILARDTFIRLARWEPIDSAAQKEQAEIQRALDEWMNSGLECPWPLPLE